MAVVAGFVMIVGIPLVLGVGVGMIPTRRPGKLALGASFPVAVVLVLLAASPFTLSDIGIGPIAVLAIFGWLLGFALAGTVRGVWRVVTR
jgi:hypothetical protein